MPSSIEKRLDDLNRQLEDLRKGGAVQPLRLQDLVGQQISAPIPIGATQQQGFAPHGPNLTFTGGLPFQPNNTGAIVHNALNFAFSLRSELEKLKKKAKEQQQGASNARA